MTVSELIKVLSALENQNQEILVRGYGCLVSIKDVSKVSVKLQGDMYASYWLVGSDEDDVENC